MDNNKTQIKMIFSIFEDNFNPIDFTKYIGINPTKFYLKGDKISSRNALLRKESAWDYAIGPVETLFVEDIIKQYLTIFENKIDKIVEYIIKNKLDVKIFIIVEMGEDETPALYFDRIFLGIIHKLNAEIDIDMYR
jgi:Domain of unknown function (DUF4279)